MKLYEIVGNVLNVDPATLSSESNAQNTPNWDSLNHIEVIFAVESAYHIRLSMLEIAGLRNLGDIERVLTTKSLRLYDDEGERKSA